ncbi:apyrase-like [Contarinia nasturtii]|uniref:apyrase-like n=1 Tax=Contarinia nasturtii TaxID=265458 RepID=UPI0012D3CE11|nr:apyrase-like [Contarinia nasturtii]
MKISDFNWISILFIHLFLRTIDISTMAYRHSSNIPKDVFPLSLIHLNDFHSRFEETNKYGLDCKREEREDCIGGYARVVAVVKELQRTGSNTIYLNAGDNFAGTIWYTFGRWNVTSHFLNLLRADVMTLGNHEFDQGPKELASFLDTIQTPIVLANIDLNDEVQLKGKFKNSIILNRGNRRIGIIGLISSNTNLESNTGNIIFLDAVETVRREANKLEAEGVNIIVVLSHCGIDVDFQIAREAGSNVDVIVGAHSHTFMYNGDPPGVDSQKYNYPVVVEQNNGHRVLIVQAASFAKYVGNLTVYFNELGEATRWEGQPVYLGPNVQQDEQILNELIPWREKYQNKKEEPIAETSIVLNYTSCWYDECLMGDFLTDAYLHSYRKTTNDSGTAVAFAQGGGIRATIQKGSITFGDLIMVQPFNNRVDSFDLLGQYIWDAIEYSSTNIHDKNTNEKHMLQISGMKIVLNATELRGHRVVSINIFNELFQYEPIDVNRSYRVVATDFLAAGGNGYSMFAEHRQNYIPGEADIDALTNYMKFIQKVEKVDVGRIVVLI